jgi:hypothetical protein
MIVDSQIHVDKLGGAPVFSWAVKTSVSSSKVSGWGVQYSTYGMQCRVFGRALGLVMRVSRNAKSLNILFR